MRAHEIRIKSLKHGGWVVKAFNEKGDQLSSDYFRHSCQAFYHGEQMASQQGAQIFLKKGARHMCYVLLGSGPEETVNNRTGFIDETHDQEMRNLLLEEVTKIRSTFGLEPTGALLDVILVPRPWGGQWEVVCYYDATKEKASDYAHELSQKLPMFWGYKENAHANI